MKAETKYDKRAFTIKEAADYACVSETTIRNWIFSGIIPFEELPGSGDNLRRFRLIRKSDLDEFLNGHYNKSRQYKDKILEPFHQEFSFDEFHPIKLF